MPPTVPAQEDPANVVTVGVTRSGLRRIACLAALLVAAGALVQSGAVQAAWKQITGENIRVAGPPVEATGRKLDQREIDRILGLAPQQQAEQLLQAATNHYEGATDLIQQHVDEWRGHLEFNQKLNDLDLTARYSNDLRVRAATTEILLATFQYGKDGETVDRLVRMAEENPSARPHATWALGMLGNRGVQTERIIDTLERYVDDPDDKTQFWAVESIAIVRTKETIPILLRIFHDGKTRTQRERAGCGLAKSGAYTQEERMLAVPTLVDYVERNDVDPETRSWFFQALREITNMTLPNDPAAWRKWLIEDGHAKPYGSKAWAVRGNS
ncbi:MAG TPA: HEAT repeat domain-containing protein [Terriglobales bacterium]|nr:HEAT repeat domain-containing protein [Terriglobales bacterium]